MIKNSTILITGGSQGLGLEMAMRFMEAGNTVVVCSRTSQQLEKVKSQYPQLNTFACDLSIEGERERLCQWIIGNFPQINVLINNAAIAHANDFMEDASSYDKARKEIETNLIAPIHLIKMLYPVLSNNSNSQIINITTGLVYVPRALYPIYNATKAALHSFTQVLRHQLQASAVRVVEVLFPVVDTSWYKGKVPRIAITPQEAVKGMMNGLRANKEEIQVGAVKLLAVLVRVAPKFAFKKINALR